MRRLLTRGKLTDTGQLVDLHLEDGIISRIKQVDTRRPPDVGGADLYLAPAPFDIQLNGFAGQDYNAPPFDEETARTIVQRMLTLGVTQHLACITTGSHERMLASIRAVTRARQDPKIAAAIPGVHVEGPYLSPDDGPRGAHPLEHIRPPDWDEFCAFQEAAEGLIKLVTVAPERPGALDFIRKLAGEGIVVAIGHANVSPDDIRAAIDAGARLTTHLGNGCHATIDRHNNYLFQQLAEDDLWATIIVDGHHLPPALVKIIVRCKGIDRLVLISDAMAAGGLEAGSYSFGDQTVDLDETRRVSLPGTPYLAGSALDLPACVQNIVRFAEVSLSDALRMGSVNAWELLGEAGRARGLVEGAPADLILFRWDEDTKQLTLAHTIAGGEVRYGGNG